MKVDSEPVDEWPVARIAGEDASVGFGWVLRLLVLLVADLR